MKQIPPYPTATQIGLACGLTPRQARRMLHRVRIAEKHGRDWTAPESRIRDELPEVHERLYAYFVLGKRSRPLQPPGSQARSETGRFSTRPAPGRSHSS